MKLMDIFQGQMEIKKDKKLYLATFEFVSGEYAQIFNKTFYVKDEKVLEEKIHNYLAGYYGRGNTSGIEDDVYYYWNGEVAVKLDKWEEIINLEQIVHKLL